METTNPVAPLEGVSILLVEDEALIAMDLESLFVDLGAKVPGGPIPTCAGAMKAADEVQIDIAFLDVGLADGNVFPLAEKLVERNIPIAFHSGHANRSGVLRRFLNCGWVVKPSHPDDILREILGLLG